MNDEKQHEAGALKWHRMAVIIGYNELAKNVTRLGEKIYCRMARDHAEQEYEKEYGEPGLSREGEVIVCTFDCVPAISLTDKDIELMRGAVAAYDEAKANERAVVRQEEYEKERAKAKMVECGIYGCKTLRNEMDIMCDGCRQEMREDPDAFK